MDWDILICNGTVLTVNPAFDVIPNGIVGINGDRIAHVGADPGPGASAGAREIIDAGGGIVLPGLVNCHTHLPMALLRGFADDLPLAVWLNEHIFPAEGRHLNPGTVRLGTLLACAELLLGGTTTCCDGNFYEEAVAAGVLESGMRAILGQGVIDFPAPGVPDPAENVERAAAFADRWQGRSARITQAVFCHSPYTCSADTLVNAKRAAADRGLLFQIHVAETRGEQEEIGTRHGVSPVGYLERLGVLDNDTLLVHAIWVDAADIDAIGRHRAAVAHCPESNMKLAAGIAPVPALLAAGITVGLGTDGCASNNNLDLFQEMDSAAKLHKVNALDPTVLDAPSVVRMATIEGARAIGLSGDIGSIETGKQADLIVMDADAPHLVPIFSPASQLVYSARGSDVRDVLVAGRVLVRDRRLLSLDLREIMERTNRLARTFQE